MTSSNVPKWSRWSASTFVRMVPHSGSSRNVPSLSSDSTISHSSPDQWAPVPTSLTSPPTTKLGRRSASTNIIASIEVVVVLPCVPATATDRAHAQIDASMPARRSTGMPAAARRDQLDVAGGDRRRRGDGVDAGDVARVVTDVDGDARGAQAVERGRFAQVAARHLMTHLGEHERDGAHARPTDADDVVATRPSEVERHATAAPASSPALTAASVGGGRGATRRRPPPRRPGRRSGRRRRGGRGRWPEPPSSPSVGAVGGQAVDLPGQALGRQLRLGQQHGRAGVRQRAGVGGLMVLGGERPRHEHRRARRGRRARPRWWRRQRASTRSAAAYARCIRSS